ncbi:MAG: hypothetical protein H0U92_10270 [Actinobacteria bacterium]|nr:hypothetical protein [Actinomycetota bacterium]
MSPAPKKRSTILVLVGAVVFVLGTGLAALATRGSDGGGGAPAAAAVTTTIPPPGSVAPPAAAAPLAGFVIPNGHQAIALDVPFVNGVAGYAKAGDHVNVFGVFKNQAANASLPNPAAKLVLSDIEVLAATTPVGANATYVLSVDVAQAEQLVYLASFEGSYLTLARDKQGQLTTVGRTPKNEV